MHTSALVPEVKDGRGGIAAVAAQMEIERPD
jgi:hypothetical protein